MKPHEYINYVKKSIESLGGSSVFRPSGLSSEDINKIELLQANDRDFFKATPALEQSAARFGLAEIQRAFAAGVFPTKEKIQSAFGEGIKKQILLRFENNGNDVDMKSLSPGYLLFKAKFGFSLLIGKATGDLFNKLKNSTWSINGR